MKSARLVFVTFKVETNWGLEFTSHIIGSLFSPNITSTPEKSKPNARLALMAKSTYSCSGSNLEPTPPIEIFERKSVLFYLNIETIC